MAAALLLAATAAAWLVVARYVVTMRSNHVGYDPYDLGWLAAADVLLAALIAVRRRRVRALPAALVAAGVLSVGALVWLDRTNTLVWYERWVKRGMPAPSSR